jgi:distribution and morphology protein 31
MDDWSAFISWLVVGHIVWIMVGTTTFLSVLIFAINTLVAQEAIARWVGDYLTQSTGIKVVFESAVVPKWGDGVISFKNVFVSRRPGQEKAKVTKGSSMTAAAEAAAQRQEKAEAKANEQSEHDDGNYTQFDVTIDTVNVTLSFAKWWNGKGLLKDVEIKGIRGVVDRTHVFWPDEYVDPRIYKHKHVIGDFEIEHFKMEDLLLTIHQPKNFRPYSVSVFTCELPQLRKQWLFYDFLSAKQMSGSFDGSLFNIHPHQSHSPNHTIEESEIWKKHSRLRIDGLRIDHLNKGIEGPFGWIYEGNVDIVADVMFPADNDESIAKVMSDIYDQMHASVITSRYLHYLETHPQNQHWDEQEKKAHQDAMVQAKLDENDKRFLIMDMKVHLNDVRAAVPLFTRDLSYVNQALIRPIVAYINSRKTFIPINCRIVKRASEFDGSWTIYDSGLMEDVSAEVYEAFAKDVTDNQARIRRFKKVGMWSLSLALQAIFMTMSGSVA